MHGSDFLKDFAKTFSETCKRFLISIYDMASRQRDYAKPGEMVMYNK